MKFAGRDRDELSLKIARSREGTHRREASPEPVINTKICHAELKALTFMRRAVKCKAVELCSHCLHAEIS